MKWNHQQLIFDLDDTLIYCNKYFDEVLHQFFDLVHQWFMPYNVSIEEIKQKQIEIDIQGVHHLGFASHHFPQSLVDTYRYFSLLHGRIVDPREEAKLTELGMSVYDAEFEPYPGMVETLDQLHHEGHFLILYTGGETTVQQRKIDRLKLSNYFDDRIFIHKHKNIDALQSIIQKHKLKHDDTWMIGNSLRTDIAPALTAGINAIYLQQPNEWQYNIVELDVTHRSELYTISSLRDVPQIIHKSIRSKVEQSS
ncbi:HAD family hydrolase [Paenibacillus sediminis]|uniref:Hydrolase of the HAD superfamily n=1 Tax=Paenibacillus sediminis TaxID=664909 RepID=A0ABS4H0P3_9BACL|nr:HAD family hydrolase [Paenibacillus sediminis]MBP1935937.1 putative hydrolase of the HAD superfamily [Paenibacillus sediminis]